MGVIVISTCDECHMTRDLVDREICKKCDDEINKQVITLETKARLLRTRMTTSMLIRQGR